MHPLIELAPLIAFLIAYFKGGLYVATAVLMAAMAALLAIDLIRGRKVPPMHLISAVLVFMFGTATLVLHNQRFIQWKPTVFFWLASAAFLGSFWIGRQTLVEKLLGAALGEHRARVDTHLWRKLNGLWVGFYALLGCLNLIVAFNAPERTWVYFKVFGLTALTFVFVIVQIGWLARRTSTAVL